MLQEVIYVSNIQANLLMTNAKIDVQFSGGDTSLSKDGIVLAYGSKNHNIFTFNAIPSPEHICMATNVLTNAGANLWHQRMCHANYNTLDTMSRQQVIGGLMKQQISRKHLNICIVHLASILDYLSNILNTSHLSLNIIVSDVCGSFDTSMGGYRYFVIWLDARTYYTSNDFLKDKKCITVANSFKVYLGWLQNQKGAGVKVIRTDNGEEYMEHKFEDLCHELGIIHQTTSPYTPEHNSIAE